MRERFKINTQCEKLSDEEVRHACQSGSHSLANIEFVLRYFNSGWFSSFATLDETKKICDAALAKCPQHNFFNYARAKLTSDDLKSKKLYLIKTAKCCVPCGPTISAYAAYKISKYFYETATNTNKDFTEFLAWFSKAIILGSEEACEDFISNNIFNRVKFGLRATCRIFLTTYLCGVKIPGLTNSKLLKELSRSNDEISQYIAAFSQAYRYPYYTDLLQTPDSPARKIAEWIIIHQPQVYPSYFAYCFEQDIISKEAFNNLLQFYLSSSHTEENNLRQHALDILNKRNPLMRTHQATLPLTPSTSATTHSYVSSYHSLYSMTPAMIPTPNPFMATPAQPVPTLTPSFQRTTPSPSATLSTSHSPVNAESPRNKNTLPQTFARI